MEIRQIIKYFDKIEVETGSLFKFTFRCAEIFALILFYIGAYAFTKSELFGYIAWILSLFGSAAFSYIVPNALMRTFNLKPDKIVNVLIAGLLAFSIMFFLFSLVDTFEAAIEKFAIASTEGAATP